MRYVMLKSVPVVPDANHVWVTITLKSGTDVGYTVRAGAGPSVEIAKERHGCLAMPADVIVHTECYHVFSGHDDVIFCDEREVRNMSVAEASTLGCWAKMVLEHVRTLHDNLYAAHAAIDNARRIDCDKYTNHSKVGSDDTVSQR